MEKVVRVNVSEKVHERFKSIKERLSARGNKDFGFQDFADRFLLNVSDEEIEKLISFETPEEFRIQEILKDEDLRKEMIRFAEQLAKKKRQTRAESSAL